MQIIVPPGVGKPLTFDWFESVRVFCLRKCNHRTPNVELVFSEPEARYMWLRWHDKATPEDIAGIVGMTCHEAETYLARLKEPPIKPATTMKIHRVERVPIGQYVCGDNTRVGVVIGCFKWPTLARLQCRLIRKTCGPVPILLSEDCTPGKDADYARVAREECASFWPNAMNIGHGGGDLSAYWKGPQWAANLGLTHVAKISQRFLVLRANWLQEGAAELAASGLATASRICSGAEVFQMRTEAAMLDVAKWNTPEVRSASKPFRFPPDLDNESFVASVVRRYLGAVHPWSLIGEDRAEARPDVLFRLSADLDDYKSIAEQLGVGLEEAFHADGWGAELMRGEYRH